MHLTTFIHIRCYECYIHHLFHNHHAWDINNTMKIYNNKMSFEQAFKNIDDTLRKDAGCSSELDYIEQTSWILFLKYLFSRLDISSLHFNLFSEANLIMSSFEKINIGLIIL